MSEFRFWLAEKLCEIFRRSSWIDRVGGDLWLSGQNPDESG